MSSVGPIFFTFSANQIKMTFTGTDKGFYFWKHLSTDPPGLGCHRLANQD